MLINQRPLTDKFSNKKYWILGPCFTLSNNQNNCQTLNLCHFIYCWKTSIVVINITLARGIVWIVVNEQPWKIKIYSGTLGNDGVSFIGWYLNRDPLQNAIISFILSHLIWLLQWSVPTLKKKIIPAVQIVFGKISGFQLFNRQQQPLK